MWDGPVSPSCVGLEDMNPVDSSKNHGMLEWEDLLELIQTYPLATQVRKLRIWEIKCLSPGHTASSFCVELRSRPSDTLFHTISLLPLFVLWSVGTFLRQIECLKSCFQ